MESISFISAIFIGLFMLVLGWFLNQIMFKTKNAEWIKKAKEGEVENKSLLKKVKNQENQIKDFRQKADSWKQEFQLSNKEYQNLKSEHKVDIQQKQQMIDLAQKEIKAKESDLSVSERANERNKKELDQLKEKYKRDLGDYKQWKSEKSSVTAEIDSLKSKLSKLNAIAVDYKQKFESQEEQIGKVNELNRELRGLRAKVKKSAADCQYWEKKHYDVHHALANLEKDKEKWLSKLNELEELRKGDEILKQNLVGQVQEFKSKFLSVSDKYRDLAKN